MRKIKCSTRQLLIYLYRGLIITVLSIIGVSLIDNRLGIVVIGVLLLTALVVSFIIEITDV